MTSVIPNDDTRRGPDSGASKVMDAAEQIRAYLANQWKPIRLNGDTKRPVDDRWPERWVSEEDLIAWHRGGGGIGIQVGPVSDHIACVDLDTPEARQLAPHFLPDTLKAGKEAEDLADLAINSATHGWNLRGR
jgi:Bifunctional DNA primase/polymerase, N-terminal